MKTLHTTAALVLAAAFAAFADETICDWSESDGSDETSSISALDGAEEFSLSVRSVWNRTDQPGYPNVLSTGGWGARGGFMLFMRGGNLLFRVGSSDTGRWSENGFNMIHKVPVGEWTSLVVTFRRPDFTMYVNGKVASRGKWNRPMRVQGPVMIGRCPWNSSEIHDGRVDDLHVWKRTLSPDEVSALAADPRWKGKPAPQKPFDVAASFEGSHATLAFDVVGRLSSLKERTTGRELVEMPCAFANVVLTNGSLHAASRAELRGEGVLAFKFRRCDGEAVFKVTPFADGGGWSFALEALTVPDVKELQFANVKPVCRKWVGNMANAMSDEDSAVAMRAYDVALEMSASAAAGLRVRGEARRGLVGRRFGIAAGPRAGFVEQLRAMSRDSGAPLSPAGGAWSLGSEKNRNSYLFADLSLASVDDWIDFAERGGFGIIHIHGWWEWLGQYPVRKAYFPNGLDDMKATVDKIHAAGLLAGMHSLTACINPYRDPWISPSCSTSLVADAVYTLAAPVSADATEILVNERPIDKHALVFTYSCNGNCLRLGNEVVQYTGIRREKPYAFTGCKRGAFKTVPAAYPAGAQCDYLHQRYIAFYPDPDSQLARDLADKLTNVRNYCGIDAFYFDGSEGMGTRYGIDMLRRLIYERFTVPPVAEASCLGAHNWWFHSRIGAADHPRWAAKRFFDQHIKGTMESSRKANFMEPQMGWWAPIIGGPTSRGHFTDEMEYFAGKNAGFDAASSLQGVNVTRAPASEFIMRQMTVHGWYERARLARAFAPGVQEKLAEPRSEYRLRQGADGVWSLAPVTALVHRVDGAVGTSWGFTLPKKAPALLRVEALYGAAAHDAPKGTNFLTAADVPKMTVSSAGSVKASVSAGEDAEHGATVRLVAKNGGKSSRGAWTRAERTYPFPYMNLGDNNAFGLWVKGDGSGAILNFQLKMAHEYHGAICEHYVKLDFTGWRYVTLLARERDADAFAGLEWPYSGYYAIFRNPYNGHYVAAVSLLLNEVPAGGGTSVEVAAARALPMTKPALSNAVVTVNGRALRVPFTMAAGDYAELEDGAWTRYAQNGESLERAAAEDVVLAAGGNNVSFSGETAGGPARAEVTFLARGDSFPAFAVSSPAQRKALSYEAMLPFRHAPSKGFSVAPRIAVRPGESAALEMVVHGPVENPTLDFPGAGKFSFPVSLKAGQRLVCRDGRTWKAVDNERKTLAQGELASTLPVLSAGTDWRFTSSSPDSANARVEVVKRYRAAR